MITEQTIQKNMNTVKGMRVYPSLNVLLTYQNFGSTWLLVLRGASQELELVFNGLYNLCATGGNLEYMNEEKTLGIAWSSKESLIRFFSNRYSHPLLTGIPEQDAQIEKDAKAYAEMELEDLRNGCHEVFLDFQEFEAYEHAIGTISAERPDSDFKDACFSYAFSNKDLA